MPTLLCACHSSSKGLPRVSRAGYKSASSRAGLRPSYFPLIHPSHPGSGQDEHTSFNSSNPEVLVQVALPDNMSATTDNNTQPQKDGIEKVPAGKPGAIEADAVTAVQMNGKSPHPNIAMTMPAHVGKPSHLPAGLSCLTAVRPSQASQRLSRNLVDPRTSK
jgi:hypothetical protein